MPSDSSANNLPKIFFATRPIGPPWDEASKNSVFQIAKNLKNFSGVLLTYKDQEKLLSQTTIMELPIYPPNNTREVSLRQKTSFFLSLVQSQASIYHFYFTPELHSSNILRIIKKFKKGRFIQTFSTPIENDHLISKLAFGDAVVVQSDYSLERFKRQGIQNVSRIYLGVDTDVFKPGIDTNPLKLKLNILKNEPVILYGGNYYLGCNQELAETIFTLVKKNRKIKFILTCRISKSQDLKEKKHLQNILHREQVLDRVLFLEQVENMAALIEMSDLHIFPARTMTKKADIPMVLLETLSMGKPIVITDIPPLNEIMKDDVGIVVPPGNVSSLIESIQELLENPVLRQTKGKKGREMILHEFSLKSYLNHYNNLYNKLMCEEKTN